MWSGNETKYMVPAGACPQARPGRYKTWTLVYELDYGLDHRLDYGLNFGLDFGLDLTVRL